MIPIGFKAEEPLQILLLQNWQFPSQSAFKFSMVLEPLWGITPAKCQTDSTTGPFWEDIKTGTCIISFLLISDLNDETDHCSLGLVHGYLCWAWRNAKQNQMHTALSAFIPQWLHPTANVQSCCPPLIWIYSKNREATAARFTHYVNIFGIRKCGFEGRFESWFPDSHLPIQVMALILNNNPLNLEGVKLTGSLRAIPTAKVQNSKPW